MKFFQKLLENSNEENIRISSEIVEFYHAVRACLLELKPLLAGNIADSDRKKILDTLGTAASQYRLQIYRSGFWGKKRTHSMQGLKNFTQVCIDFIEHAIKANQRADKLYHAYNLMSVNGEGVQISHLSEMLEGQVAILSAGILSATESLEVLNSLRNSALYRPDQSSYILYPNKNLPKFLEKNTLSQEVVNTSKLLSILSSQGNTSILNKDLNGNYHFNGNFTNAGDVKMALKSLKEQEAYSDLIEKEEEIILDIFEQIFNHRAFTGRSGTFFAFEGLGSIYWHMVSKLHLAVYEVIEAAYAENADAAILSALQTHFTEIGAGIGIHKAPELYGAFPTDPYSHTPYHKGAQQPGMTGQVKEDILTRIGELGITVSNGRLKFSPLILQKNEFLPTEKEIEYINVKGENKTLVLPPNALAFTVCQVPIIYQLGYENKIEIEQQDQTLTVDGLELNSNISKSIFERNSDIITLKIHLLS